MSPFFQSSLATALEQVHVNVRVSRSHVLIEHVSSLVLFIAQLTIVLDISATLGLAQMPQQRLLPRILLATTVANVGPLVRLRRVHPSRPQMTGVCLLQHCNSQLMA